MRTLALIGLVAACAASAQDGGFNGRWEAAMAVAADAHVSLGEYAEKKGQLSWAKFQFERALECLAEHARAKELLARDLDWSNKHPQAPVEPGPVFQRVVEQAYKKFRPAGVEFRKVARWADGKGLKDRADEAWRRVIEYWPSCDEARKRLGHKLWRGDFSSHRKPAGSGLPRWLAGGPRWSHSAEVALREDLEKRMKTAFSGEAFECHEDHGGPQKVELRGPSCRVSLFTEEGNEEDVRETIRAAEAFSAWFHDLVDASDTIYHRIPPLSSHPPHDSIYISEKSVPEERRFYVANAKTGVLGQVVYYHYDPYFHGEFIPAGDRMQWILVGVTLLVTKTLCGGGVIGFSDTSSSDELNRKERTQFGYVPNWHRTMGEHVWLGYDPPITASIASPTSSMRWRSTIKTWSLFDFLHSAHPDRFKAILKALEVGKRDRKDPTGEKTFYKVIQLDRDELESEWRRFVLENY